MVQDKIKFLLDENIPSKFLEEFKKRKLDVVTVQQIGWSGVKNGDLSEKIFAENFVLVTRDKDFTFLWKKYRIRVV